jgi:SRSO17 transposase
VVERENRTDKVLAVHFASRYAAAGSRRSAKLRWRIERDYQELKHELGLGH